MAGMFGYANQNKGLNLPCRSSGTGTIAMSSVDLHVDGALNGSGGTTWPSDPMSLFGAHDRNVRLCKPEQWA